MTSLARCRLAAPALLAMLFLAGRSERYAARQRTIASGDGVAPSEQWHRQACGPTTGGRFSVASNARPRRRARRGATVAAFLWLGGDTAGQEVITTKDVLREMDRNRDGKVDREEHIARAMDVLEKTGERNPQVVEAVLDWSKRLFDIADITGDGFLDEREVEYLGYVNAAEVYASMFLHFFEDAAEPNAEGGEEPGQCIDDFSQHAFADLLVSLDIDGSGAIERPEFYKAVRSVYPLFGWEESVDSWKVKKWMRVIFNRADVTGDAKLNAKELQYADLIISHAVGQSNPSEDSLIGTLLELLDTNRDDRIDAQELAELTRRLEEEGGWGGEGLPRPALLSRLTDNFANIDTNGDGSLDVEELRRFAMSMIKENLRRLPEERREF